jgi:hypothetical protein
MMDPPSDGTNNPICGSAETAARSVQSAVNGDVAPFSPATSISLFVVGIVALVASVVVGAFLVLRKRNTAGNDVEMA